MIELAFCLAWMGLIVGLVILAAIGGHMVGSAVREWLR
jgi:hypothetical protein